MTKQITMLVGSMAMASCSPDYVYRPAENATATITGRVAADYQVHRMRVEPTAVPYDVEWDGSDVKED